MNSQERTPSSDISQLNTLSDETIKPDPESNLSERKEPFENSFFNRYFVIILILVNWGALALVFLVPSNWKFIFGFFFCLVIFFSIGLSLMHHYSKKKEFGKGLSYLPFVYLVIVLLAGAFIRGISSL
jgi:hypothetical protein